MTREEYSVALKRKPRAEALTSMQSRVDWKSPWEGTNQGDVIGVGGGFEEEAKDKNITVIGNFSTPYKAMVSVFKGIQ
jgi:hypothetical protein